MKHSYFYTRRLLRRVEKNEKIHLENFSGKFIGKFFGLNHTACERETFHLSFFQFMLKILNIIVLNSTVFLSEKHPNCYKQICIKIKLILRKGCNLELKQSILNRKIFTRFIRKL